MGAALLKPWCSCCETCGLWDMCITVVYETPVCDDPCYDCWYYWPCCQYIYARCHSVDGCDEDGYCGHYLNSPFDIIDVYVYQQKSGSSWTWRYIIYAGEAPSVEVADSGWIYTREYTSDEIVYAGNTYRVYIGYCPTQEQYNEWALQCYYQMPQTVTLSWDTLSEWWDFYEDDGDIIYWNALEIDEGSAVLTRATNSYCYYNVDIQLTYRSRLTPEGEWTEQSGTFRAYAWLGADAYWTSGCIPTAAWSCNLGMDSGQHDCSGGGWDGTMMPTWQIYQHPTGTFHPYAHYLRWADDCTQELYERIFTLNV